MPTTLHVWALFYSSKTGTAVGKLKAPKSAATFCPPTIVYPESWILNDLNRWSPSVMKNLMISQRSRSEHFWSHYLYSYCLTVYLKILIYQSIVDFPTFQGVCCFFFFPDNGREFKLWSLSRRTWIPPRHLGLRNFFSPPGPPLAAWNLNCTRNRNTSCLWTLGHRNADGIIRTQFSTH